jgi:hypothetical protein
MISVHFDATPVIDFKSAANGIMIHSKILSWITEEFILRHPLMKVGL